MILSILGLVFVALIIGIALGSILLASTKTETTTQTDTKTITQTLVTNTTGQSYPLVTVTFQYVQVYPIVPSCTTVSGRATTVYTEAVGGSTTFTYLYPSNPPSQFYVTVVTASDAEVSNATQTLGSSCWSP